MRKMVAAMFSILLVTACGPRQNLPEGVPEPIDREDLLQKVEQNSLSFKKLRLSGMAHFTSKNQDQKFRFDIRLLRDSLVWIDVADPIIGLKVARAVVTRDSVHFINRFEKTYYRGTPGRLQQRFQLDFDFAMFIPLLSGNLLPTRDSLQLSYAQNAYRLTNYPPLGDTASSSSMNGRLVAFSIHPDLYKPTEQIIRIPKAKKSYKTSYTFREGAFDFAFARKINLEYRHNGLSQLKMEVRSVERNKNFRFPFDIPSSYAPLP